MAGYSHRTLSEKLGITPKSTKLFINIPEDYQQLLGQDCKSDIAETYDFIHVFYTSQKQLIASAPLLKERLNTSGMLWVSWPKKSAQKLVPSDLTEQDFRDILLPFGLVDTKVCAVTDVWSGLKFVWRKS